MDAVGSAVGGIVGGSMSASASKKAAQIQADAQLKAAQLQIEEQDKIFNKQQELLSPYMATGTQALSSLNKGMADGGYFTKNFTMADMETDPGYQFDLQQGLQAVQRSAAAQGTLSSGGTLKSIANYTKGLASEEVNNAYNRYVTNQNNQFNRLSAMATLGSNAAATLTGAAQNQGNQVGTTLVNTTIGAGNATAGGVVGSSNAISQAITGASNTYSQYTTLNKLLEAAKGKSGANLNDTSSEGSSTLSQIGDWFSNLFK